MAGEGLGSLQLVGNHPPGPQATGNVWVATAASTEIPSTCKVRTAGMQTRKRRCICKSFSSKWDMLWFGGFFPPGFILYGTYLSGVKWCLHKWVAPQALPAGHGLEKSWD